MINRNFRSIEKMLLQASPSLVSGYGSQPVRNVYGETLYITENLALMDANIENSDFTYDAYTKGVSFGSGGTPATAYDFNLESTIGSSGLTTAVTSDVSGVDYNDGSFYREWSLTITNNGSSTVTIREIGYKKNIRTAKYPGSSDTSTATVILIDRTVLDDPLVLVPTDAGRLIYRIKVPFLPAKYVNGVKIVSWEYGSEEDITAMIQAAHAGTIDLQSDAGWYVGARRPFTLGEFTNTNGNYRAPRMYDLVITSFDDYENCGCVMQVDFYEVLYYSERMNATNTNVGGYGASEMYLSTLPAIYEAMPQYLKDLLMTFTVKASAGNKSSTIVEVTGNKLALRSAVEMSSAMSSYNDEGQTISYYDYAQARRMKKRGRTSGDLTGLTWLRSPYRSNATQFLEVSTTGAVGVSTTYAANSGQFCFISPFGCL